MRPNPGPKKKVVPQQNRFTKRNDQTPSSSSSQLEDEGGSFEPSRMQLAISPINRDPRLGVQDQISSSSSSVYVYHQSC